jgi:hypothetical protein
VNRIPAALVALVLATLFAGCVTTLNVGYDEARAQRGPLSAIGSRRIRIDVTDRRPWPGEVIGYIVLRSGGSMYFPIATYYPDVLVAPRPVREIVQDALAAELRKNGHAVVTSEADRSLTVDVREFWVSSEEGFWGFRFPGTMLIHMTVTDGRTGQTLLTRDYQGQAVGHGQMNAKWNWKGPLNAALDTMMRDVATDPRLVEALGAMSP